MDPTETTAPRPATAASPEAVRKLLQILDSNIHWFKKQADEHKKVHRLCASTVIALTASTTITASLGLVLGKEASRVLQFLVVALTATATAVGAWSEMRRARELWRHERAVGYSLKDIRRELMFRQATSGLSAADVDAYFSRANAIISSSSSQWSLIHAPKHTEASLQAGGDQS
jgi:hypothetical protein